MQDKPFALNGKVTIMHPEGNEAMRRNASFMAGYIERLTGLRLNTMAYGNDKYNDNGDGKDKGKSMDNGNICLRLGLEADNPEAYRITVTQRGVTIEGKTEAGVFYGMQTLRKAMRPGRGGTTLLPAAVINDEPRFGYRGAHYDVSRHFFSVEDTKRYIDMMALHNMNRLHWHITDDQGWRLEIKSHPELTAIGSWRKETVIGHNTGRYDGKPYGGHFTQQEVRDIVRYAAERFITIIPEIDMPGHMQAALAAYPHLGCTGGPYEVWTMWGVSDDVLCAGNDSVLSFIDDVLGEVVALFPSKYIHVGGDECPKTRWKACPRCQARIKALGLKDDSLHTAEDYLQSFIINHAEKFLNSKGRQIIGWDEVLDGKLSAGATVMSWRGEGGGIKAARLGHDVIMVPNNYLYFDYYQTDDIANEPEAIGGYVPIDMVYGYEPYSSKLTPQEQKHIIGVQANHWSEYIPTFSHLQYMALPRWAALSEIQWCRQGSKDYDAFQRRLLRLTRHYDALGYSYARHIFNVNASYKANAKTGCVNVSMRTIDNAPIHYTLDGSQPTELSPVAGPELNISGDAKLRAMAIRPGGNSSRVTGEDIAFSLSTCKPITANLPVNRQYEYGGVGTLVDGLRGNTNYKTGRWIAFFKNDMDVTIDLMAPTPLNRLTMTTNVEKGDWIFDLRGILIETSMDGVSFTPAVSETYPAMRQSDRNGIYTHSYPLSATARYIRIKAQPEHSIPSWHGGKGNPAFLFVDEIEVR